MWWRAGFLGPGVKNAMPGRVIPFGELFFFFSYALDGYVLKEMNVLTFLLFAIGKMDIRTGEVQEHVLKYNY